VIHSPVHIQAAARRVDSEAAKRGLNVSGITSRAVAGAHDALHKAEGHAARAMDTAQQNVEKRMGAGMYLPHGSGMLQVMRTQSHRTHSLDADPPGVDPPRMRRSR
jgi:tRNA threonylcarbamoyladenosine modification (KEOPS) complex Cgi121 subunit